MARNGGRGLQVNDSTTELTCRIPDKYCGWRLDQALADLYPDYSRSCLQQWIRAARVAVDGQTLAPRSKLHGGEWLAMRPLAANADHAPQQIDLAVIYEDEHILVIDKPSGLVMHPAAGNRDGTVQNGLLYRDANLADVPRAGIVHRLDKDTTGLFVVARTRAAHASLVAQLQARQVQREYCAIVAGVPLAGGSIVAPIGRHPRDRKQMAVVAGGKPAVTRFRVLEKFRAHAWLRLQLETGRTHQIRVHLAHRQYPLVGDPVYARRSGIAAGVGLSLAGQLRAFPRQALHAVRLRLRHPHTGEEREWHSRLPGDLQGLLSLLRRDAGG